MEPRRGARGPPDALRAPLRTEACGMTAPTPADERRAPPAVRACVPPKVLALAILVAEADVEFADRWAAAGTDWVARGALLHEALVFLLTPDPGVLTDSPTWAPGELVEPSGR